METRDIVVVGASSGGVEAVCRLLESLPADLPASVFIAQHVGEQSRLARVFARCTEIPTDDAVDGARIVRKHVYIAPADHHLLLVDGHVQLAKTARENRHRPSVDVLFRSAARVYGRRAIGVVLSGSLDDGAAGALAIKSRGGTVIVQKPEDAAFPEMPRHALKATEVDHCLPLAEIGPKLATLVRQNLGVKRNGKVSREKKALLPLPINGAESFTCPECNGPLYQVPAGLPGQVKCIVGHRFSPESLSAAHKETLERILYSAMRMLKERAAIYRNMVENTKENIKASMGKRLLETAEASERDVILLQQILERL